MDKDAFIAAGKDLCGRHGWQTRLAEKLGVNRKTVSRYAKGERKIPLSTALAMSALREGIRL